MRLGARLGWLVVGVGAAALVVLLVLPALLPGGTERGLLAARSTDPAAQSALRHDLHLDRTVPVRFELSIVDAAHGDLGYSPVSGVDVGAVVGERLAESLGLAAAAGALALLLTRRRRAARRTLARGSLASGALPAALWALPLAGAVAVASRFGWIPAPDPHAAIVSRIGASLLPAATLGVALAVWSGVARRTPRDAIAAVTVGTLVTEAVFGLPGLGALVVDGAMRPDPMILRGALFAVSIVAIVAASLTLGHAPPGTTEPDGGVGPLNRRSNGRRAANGVLASLWLFALVAATVARLDLGLAPAGRIGTRIGEGISAGHPFGTDGLGRDVLARVLATARGSLLLLVAAMLIATVAGTAIGAVVAFLGGRVEQLGVAVLAAWTAFPPELVALALLAFNGRDGRAAACALALVAAPAIAAGAQRRTLAALERADARQATGAFLRSVGANARPGLLRATLATTFLGAARVVVAELVAGLLGLGPTATQTWSHEIATQLTAAAQAPAAVLAPVAVALATAIALAGLGNAVRPRSAAR